VPIDGVTPENAKACASLLAAKLSDQLSPHMRERGVKIEQNASGWELMSLWVADENTNAVKIIDRLQFEAYNGINRFRLEFNTSQDPVKVGRGPLVAYVRNFVMLRDVVDEAPLFLRPLAGVPPPPVPGPAPPTNVRIVS